MRPQGVVHGLEPGDVVGRGQVVEPVERIEGVPDAHVGTGRPARSSSVS